MNLILLLLFLFVCLYLIKGYLQPARLFYRYLYSFLFFGFGFSLICLIILLAITRRLNDDTFLIVLSILGCCAVLLFGYRSYYSNIETKTVLVKQRDEVEILSDKAKLYSRNYKYSGRLILTNRRVAFVSADSCKSQFDFYLKEENVKIEITRFFGIPRKVKIPNEDIFIEVKFPLFWRNEIQGLRVVS